MNNSVYTNRVITNAQSEYAFGNGPAPAVASRSSQRARHPEYSDRTKRLFSFARWSFAHVQDPTILANYGFFFTEQGDLVRCYYCSLGLKDFIQSDDPLLEHVRYSGERCEFLIQLLGPTRLAQIKRSIATGHPVPPTDHTEYNQGPQNSRETASCQGQSQPQTPTPKPQKVVPSKYRHPEYNVYSVRLASFVGWPTHLVQTPEQLAEAGFYYTGARDVVRCWSCDGGLQRWDPLDDPWVEHCVNFPHCAFLKETKGENYIALAISHYKPTNVPKGQPKAVAKATTNPEHISKTFNTLQIKDEPLKRKTTDNHEVISKLSEMGYKYVEIESAIQSLRNSKMDISVDTAVEKIEQIRSEDVEAQPRSRKDVIEERERLLSQLFCIKCRSAEINSLFLPCQHHRFCMGCSEDVTDCPVCGRRIDHKIKTYRP